MSWLGNEPTDVGSLLFATNYWTSVLMHGWIRIFVTQLFGDIFRLFQSCPCECQTNDERDWYCGNFNTPSQSCRNFFVRHFFVYLPYYPWWIVNVHIKQSDVTMVSCLKSFCEIISRFSSPGAHTIRYVFKFTWSINQQYWPFIDRDRCRFIVLLQIPFSVLFSTKIVVWPCFQPISSRVRRNTLPFFAL